MLNGKRIQLTTSSWLLCDLAIIYRPYIKWGPSLISQVLQELLPSNFVKYVEWQKNSTNDIVMTVTWSGHNLQTRYKMRTRFGISGSTSIISFKFCQISWDDKRISSVTSSYLSGGFSTICRLGTKWGPELIF